MPSPSSDLSADALISAHIKCHNAYEAFLLAYHSAPGAIRNRRIEQGFDGIEAAARAVGYRLEKLPDLEEVTASEVAA